MSRIHRAAQRWLALLMLAAAGAAAAQPAANDYQPTYGQPGKDVVWIPTPDHVVEKMLDMARVTSRDYVIDLGSGDGRNVIAAARRGARALGVEFNPDLVTLSKRNAAAAGVAERAAFVHGDMFEADISQATVLPLFLLPSNLEKLAPKFIKLQPGARIVSNTYEIGGGWEPDETARTEPCKSWCIAHLYVVPAQVAGTWRLENGAWLTLEQHYQKLGGSYQLDDLAVPLAEGHLDGYKISFKINELQYTGQINGETMSGVARGRANAEWSATLVRE